MIHKKLGMDKDYLATKAIPFLFPLAVEPGLNLSQVICVTRLNNGDVIDQVLKNALYLSVNIFSTKVLIGNTILMSLAGDGTTILRGHPSKRRQSSRLQ